MMEARDRAVLEFITKYAKRTDVGPSIREIMDALKERSERTVNLSVKRLEADGHIRRMGPRKIIMLPNQSVPGKCPHCGYVEAGENGQPG